MHYLYVPHQCKHLNAYIVFKPVLLFSTFRMVVTNYYGYVQENIIKQGNVSPQVCKITAPFIIRVCIKVTLVCILVLLALVCILVLLTLVWILVLLTLVCILVLLTLVCILVLLTLVCILVLLDYYFYVLKQVGQQHTNGIKYLPTGSYIHKWAHRCTNGLRL